MTVNYRWNTGNTTNSNWSNKANWSGGVVPYQAGDVVNIPAGGNGTSIEIILDRPLGALGGFLCTGSGTINIVPTSDDFPLALSDTLIVDQGVTLNLSTGLALQDNVSINTGTSNPGTFILNGSISGAGGITIPLNSSAMIELNSNNNIYSDVTIIDGSLNLSIPTDTSIGYSQVTVGPYGELLIQPSQSASKATITLVSLTVNGSLNFYNGINLKIGPLTFGSNSSTSLVLDVSSMQPIIQTDSNSEISLNGKLSLTILGGEPVKGTAYPLIQAFKLTGTFSSTVVVTQLEEQGTFSIENNTLYITF